MQNHTHYVLLGNKIYMCVQRSLTRICWIRNKREKRMRTRDAVPCGYSETFSIFQNRRCANYKLACIPNSLKQIFVPRSYGDTLCGQSLWCLNYNKNAKKYLTFVHMQLKTFSTYTQMNLTIKPIANRISCLTYSRTWIAWQQINVTFQYNYAGRAQSINSIILRQHIPIYLLNQSPRRASGFRIWALSKRKHVRNNHEIRSFCCVHTIYSAITATMEPNKQE